MNAEKESVEPEIVPISCCGKEIEEEEAPAAEITTELVPLSVCQLYPEFCEFIVIDKSLILPIDDCFNKPRICRWL